MWAEGPSESERDYWSERAGLVERSEMRGANGPSGSIRARSEQKVRDRLSGS